jgi:hypothetical protein
VTAAIREALAACHQPRPQLPYAASAADEDAAQAVWH